MVQEDFEREKAVDHLETRPLLDTIKVIQEWMDEAVAAGKGGRIGGGQTVPREGGVTGANDIEREAGRSERASGGSLADALRQVADPVRSAKEQGAANKIRDNATHGAATYLKSGQADAVEKQVIPMQLEPLIAPRPNDI